MHGTRARMGGWDVFISRITSDGTELDYSTYLGGSNHDSSWEMSLDTSGTAIITGTALSDNFPVTAGAYDTTFTGFSEAFIARVDFAGSAPIFSTFLGGSDWDSGGNVVIAPSGQIFVTGETSSDDFPATINAYDDTYNGNDDIYVAGITPDGSSLTYATFIGGSEYDNEVDTFIDSAGNLYIGGETESFDFPVTDNAYDMSYNGGWADVFITKFNVNNLTVDYSSFFGGSDEDYIWSSVLSDAIGIVYLAGETYSSDIPVTADAISTTNSGEWDGFFSKLELGYSLTPVGTNVEITPNEIVAMDFDEVTAPGYTSVSEATSTEASNFNFVETAFDISTSASFTPPVLVSFQYDEAGLAQDESELKLYHFENGNWVDVTISVDTVNNVVTGEVSTLSPFSLGVPSVPPTGVNANFLIALSFLLLGTGGLMRMVSVSR